MKPDEEILSALNALKECDREVVAPPHLEIRLRAAFRKSHRRKQTAIWMACAAAAAIIIAAMFWKSPQPAPTRSIAQAPQRTPVIEPMVKAVAKEIPKPRIAPRRYSREIVTEFFPLMDAPPPIGHGEMVRVRVPSSAMRTVGLPVREDRLSEPVQADVLVSEEGLATAIRFVKTSQ